MRKHIYLDYNASAPLHPSAKEAMINIMSEEAYALNASSVHTHGRKGRQIIENARQKIADLVNADTNQVIFNSGATEGNNTVIRHFAEKYPDETVFISAIEHPSVLELSNLFDNVKTLPVNQHGLVEESTLNNALNENKTSLFSCIYAHNETGIIQDIALLSDITHKYGAFFHTDATQAAGRIPLDIKAARIDFTTISSHKIGGPQGVGALILGMCGQTPTLIHGGGQEKFARAGTENVVGIAGFGATAQFASENLNNYQKLSEWRDKLETEIAGISPETIIHGINQNRLANTSFFSLPGQDSQTLLMAFDLDGIAVSNGSACSSGTVKPSTTLTAMGMDKTISGSALRVSMGWATQESDVDAFIKSWEKIYTRIKSK